MKVYVQRSHKITDALVKYAALGFISLESKTKKQIEDYKDFCAVMRKLTGMKNLIAFGVNESKEEVVVLIFDYPHENDAYYKVEKDENGNIYVEIPDKGGLS